MGIPGLWAEVASAAQTTTLPSYCLTAFTENANELRGLRLGIDASLWLFHAQQSSGGANPYLRLLFYRLAKLLSLPVLPVFVFDGPSRPNWKRGKQIKGRQYAIEQPFTQLIEAFGYQWHRAQGEAEAELACLNQTGHLDAVLTDDSDALLFGAQVLIRNWGKNLSGTKALSRTTSTNSDAFDEAADVDTASTSKPQLSGSDRDHLITLYRADDLVTTPNLGIDRDGLILIALMSGGDYDTTGLMQCGIKIALALARGGYGTTLVKAFKDSYPDLDSASRTSNAFETFIKGWLEEVREELRTNGKGFLPSRRPKLASSIEENFLSTQESRKVLAWYVYPLTSESTNKDVAFNPAKGGEPDLIRLARLCQIYFNWSRGAILSKFRTILGPGAIARQLRQEVLEHKDGAGEGPWAALVESPASKAVRRHMLGLDKGDGQSHSNHNKTSAANKKKPSHESPNASRITDFFSKSAKSAVSPTTSGPRTLEMDSAKASVDILAIKLERRHAALAPFLDYRALVSMAEFARTADKGINSQLDAELAASRAQNEESETELDEHDEGRPARSAPKRADPEDPLLMWIPEPLLSHSTSGNGPLNEFRTEALRKANAARNKLNRKTPSSSSVGSKAGQQRSLMDFAKPVAKAALPAISRGKISKFASTSGPQQAEKASEATQSPRKIRQLVVPKGMQRRTESFPVSTSIPSAPLGSARGMSRHTSLPSQPELEINKEIDELDGDSSIEFLGSFVSAARQGTDSTGDIHSRSSTPSNPTSSEKEGSETRPKKSPKKSMSTRANDLFSKPSFSAAGATKLAHSHAQDEVFTPFGAGLAKRNQGRLSSITISDDSFSE